MKIQDFVVLDLETTGLSVKEDQILEIGAVKVQGGEVTASYETFVNPGRKVPERITELTGIRDEMIANAPDVETAVRGFLDFCGGLPLLGHNILFDYSFIKQAAINARLDFEKEAWDTLKIARKASRIWRAEALKHSAATIRSRGNTHTVQWTMCWKRWHCSENWKKDFRKITRNGLPQRL